MMMQLWVACKGAASNGLVERVQCRVASASVRTTTDTNRIRVARRAYTEAPDQFAVALFDVYEAAQVRAPSERLTHQEMAEVLGISREAVRRWVERGRRLSRG